MANFSTLLAKVHNRTIAASEVNDPDLRPHERDALVKAITETHSQPKEAFEHHMVELIGTGVRTLDFNSGVLTGKSLRYLKVEVVENGDGDDVEIELFNGNLINISAVGSTVELPLIGPDSEYDDSIVIQLAVASGALPAKVWATYLTTPD